VAVTARKRPGLYQASCTLTDQVGDLVYITSAANGFYKVKRCNPASYAMMPAWGVIVQKYSTTKCTVQTQGEVRNIYTGLIPNKTYSVSSSGRPTFPAQFPLGGFVMHQIVGVAIDTGVLYLRPADPTRLAAG